LKKEQKLIVTKSNDLIENYIFNATESELQILNYAVSRLNTLEDNKNVISTLYIKDIASTYKTKSKNNYELYKSALFRLMKREYVYYDKNNKKHTENLVIRVTEDLSDDSYLVFKFNDYVSQRLSNLKKLFTSYDIKNIAMFKSRYAFMLYDIFKMKLSQSENRIYHLNISVDDFRKNLGVSDKHKLFSDLKRAVLEKAKDSINKHSDITISYQEIKTGKKVTHLKFIVKYKKITKVEKIEEQKELKLEIIKHEKRKIKTPEKIQKDKSMWAKLKQNFKL